MKVQYGRMLAMAGLVLALVAGAHAQQAQPEVKEVKVSATQFTRGAPLPAWVEPYGSVPPSTDRSPLVALLADSQLLAAQQPAFFVHRLWRINANSALNEVTQLTQIDFNPAYHAVKLHTLKVHRNGSSIDKLAGASITFLQRETGLEQGVYSGEVLANILMDDLRVGDVLEFAYTREGANPVLGGRFVEYSSWDQAHPTEVRRITLKHPATHKVQWRLLGDAARNAPAPQESAQGGMRKLRWEGRSLPRTDAEQNTPEDFVAYGTLQFSDFQSWAEVSQWGEQLFRVEATDSPEIAAQVARLQALPTRQERVAAALRWVQGEIRYLSLSLGESSHRPAQPAVTVQRRWGDCKDKSLLLVHLLRSLGIPAQPVLVSSRTLKNQSKLLPTPFVFDHVIVRAEVDGQEYFLDATRDPQPSRLDTMGQVWEGAQVLVMRQGTDGFHTIKSRDFEALSRNELSEKISIPKLDGEGSIAVRHTWSGSAAEYRRQLFAQVPQDVLRKALLEPYEERFPGVSYAEFPRLEDDAAANVLTLVMALKVPQPATASGNAWAVRLRAPNLVGLLKMPPSATRSQPFALPGPVHNKYALEVEFPPEVSKVADPLQRVVRDESFELVSNLAFRGNRATANMQLRLLTDRVEPARTAAYMAAVRRTAELPGAIFVDRADVKAASLLKGAPTLQQSIALRLQDRVEKVSRAIESGRLEGEDLAEARCDKAEALLDMGKAEDGLKEASLAVKQAPNSWRTHGCRAHAYFANGDFARAVADYTRAISLGASDPDIYYSRGRARFYAGQLQQAADDFAKSGLERKGTDEQDSVLYSELWRVWTQKRLGIQPSPAQARLAAADPRGEWPRAALAMLHGQMSVQDMLSTLDAKKGDERELALAEAYFYAGQWYMLQGDKATAADYFRKTREKGITMYVEHVGAGFELRALGTR